VDGQLHAPVPIGWGQPQRRSDRGGEEKKSLRCPCRELNPGRPDRRLVTTLTDLQITLNQN